MASFYYKAKNLAGKIKEGGIEAADKKEMIAFLKEQGYFLLDFKAPNDEIAVSPNKTALWEKVSGIFGVPLTEKLFFTRNLAVMTETGVSLVRAFEILSLQAKSKKLKKSLLDIAQKVNKGKALSQALADFPSIFPPLYTETIKVGEETGQLNKALQTLALQMEKEHNLKSQIISAMMYPVIVLVMAFFIGIFMMIFAVPQLKKAFAEMDAPLPLTTKIILGLGDFLAHQWYLALILLAILGFILFFFLKKGKAMKLKAKIFLHIPIISKIVKQTNSALALRTLSSLLSAGVPIVKSLTVAAGALSNYYFKESLLKGAGMVEKGEKMSVALRPYQKIYSPMVLQMMEVGEETGATADVLLKLADFLEAQVAASTERLSSIIEPVLILFIGGVVGFFAVSMMQPMFSIMQNVK